MSDSSSPDDPLDAVAEAFLARYRRGERPALAEYTDQYPELADRIRDLFPALVVIEEVGPADLPAGLAQDNAMPASLGEYRILREIGRGGMGVVYEAVQESLNRHVALKVLPGRGQLALTHLERFQREARAAARLHHTNIVPVFGVGCHGALHYYAMQYIEGQSLDAVLRELRWLQLRQGPPCPAGVGSVVVGGLLAGHFDTPPLETLAPTLPVPAMPPIPAGVPTSPARPGSDERDLGRDAAYYRTMARLGVQVAEALDHAHRQGILHRDIKPSNLLLDTHGTVWVTDFGLAYATGTEGEEEALTGTGDVVGTLRYLPPERLRGQSDVRGDVYSLGLTLYELLTLRPAFADADRAMLVERVLHEAPPRPRQLDRRFPADLETIVLKATAKDPGERYPSARALADDLRRFLEDRPVEARRPTPLQRLRKWAWRHRAMVRAAGVLLVLATMALATGTFLLWREQGRTRVAHDRAQKNLRRALQALDDAYLDVIEDRHGWDPGLHVADRLFLQRALAFYEQFIEDNPDEPTVRLETGKAYGRVGAIRSQLGLHEQAQEGYARSIAILEQLASESPDDLDPARALARSHHNLGLLLADKGDLTGAEAAYRSALALQEELAERFPNAPDHHRGLGATRVNLALLLALTGRPREAETEHRRALAFRDQLAASVPGVAVHRVDLASSHTNLARLLAESGRHSEADGSYRQSVSLWRQLVQEFPAVAGHRRGLAMSLNFQGLLLRDLGRSDEAEQAFRAALAHRQQVAGDFPNIEQYRIELSITQNNLGLVLRDTGRAGEAEALYREAVAAHQRRAADSPAMPRHQHELSTSLHNLGRLLQETGRGKEAEQAYRQAITLREELATQSPAVPAYRRDLAYSLNSLGLLLADASRTGEAEPLYRRALRLGHGLVAEVPEYKRHRRSLAQTNHNLGLLLTKTGKPQEAEALHREALGLQEELKGVYHADPEYRGELARSCNALGVLLKQSGRREEAERLYRQAVELGEKLVGERPRSTEFTRDLARVTRNLSLLLWETGRSAEAVRALGRVVELQPNNHEASNNLAWWLVVVPGSGSQEVPKARSLAESATRLAPKNGSYWSTLGAVHCRAGEWRAAVSALEKARQLDPGREGRHAVFLSLAHNGLGDREEARRWYERAAAWVAKHRPGDAEMRRLLGEAEAALAGTGTAADKNLGGPSQGRSQRRSSP